MDKGTPGRPTTNDKNSRKSKSVMGNPLPKLNPANIVMSDEAKKAADAEVSATTQQNNKKRSASRTTHGISNVVTKFSFATKGGIAAHNPYKVNQDAYLTNPNLLNLRHCHFFSVCDGHGHYG